MAGVGNSVYGKLVAGGNGDAVQPLTNGAAPAKGFIGWTPDPTNASVNGGESNSTQGGIKGSGTAQAQPVNTASQ